MNIDTYSKGLCTKQYKMDQHQDIASERSVSNIVLNERIYFNWDEDVCF